MSSRLYDLGFERGWGCDVGRTRASMRLLLDILQVGGGPDYRSAAGAAHGWRESSEACRPNRQLPLFKPHAFPPKRLTQLTQLGCNRPNQTAPTTRPPTPRAWSASLAPSPSSPTS